jgi:ketosteroid isomerase-like protein
LKIASSDKEIIMKTQFLLAACVTVSLVIAAQPAFSRVGQDGGPSGVFSYSKDAQVAAIQKQVKAVVARYQDGLNSSDFSKIRPVFAAHAVAEWNEKATVIGVEEMAKPYDELFKKIKFNTDFQFDAVDLYGDVAIVRTHHPVGSTEFFLADGSKKLDFNREIFILRRVNGDWKIILYTFNTQPRQGEQ